MFSPRYLHSMHVCLIRLYFSLSDWFRLQLGSNFHSINGKTMHKHEFEEKDHKGGRDLQISLENEDR